MQTGCKKGDKQTDLIAPGNLRIWGSGDAHASDPKRTCSMDEDSPDEMAVDLRRVITPCFRTSMKVKADCFKLVLGMGPGASPRSGDKADNDVHGSQNIRGLLGALQNDRRGHSLEPPLARTEGHGLGIEVASLCSSTTKVDC
jgi:hypothetical protein